MTRRRVGCATCMFAEPRAVPIRVSSNFNLARVEIQRPNGFLVKMYRLSSARFSQSVMLDPGQYILYVQLSTTLNPIVSIEIDGKPYGTGGAYAARALRVPFTIAAPTAGGRAAQSSAPRYEIRSPVINGAYYEGVRELNARELSSYRNRGFTVRPTTAALQAPIRVRAGARPPRAAGSGRPRRRRGVATVMAPAADARRGLRRITDGTDIRHKSTRTRIFREYNENPFSQSSSDWIAVEKVINRKLQVVLTRGSDAYRWIRAGYRIKFRNPNTPQGMRQTWWWYYTLKASNQVRWGTSPPPAQYQRNLAVSGSPQTGGGTYQGGGTSRGTSGGGTSRGTGTADVSELRRELAQLRSEIASLHSSATALGGSTSDRAAEIGALQERYNTEIADIHAKLSALGSAGTDSSAAVADIHAKIDALAAQVAASRAAAGVGGAVSGASTGLGQIGQLLPLIVIIMLLGVVAKK